MKLDEITECVYEDTDDMDAYLPKEEGFAADARFG